MDAWFVLKIWKFEAGVFVSFNHCRRRRHTLNDDRNGHATSGQSLCSSVCIARLSKINEIVQLATTHWPRKAICTEEEREGYDQLSIEINIDLKRDNEQL